MLMQRGYNALCKIDRFLLLFGLQIIELGFYSKQTGSTYAHTPATFQSNTESMQPNSNEF